MSEASRDESRAASEAAAAGSLFGAILDWMMTPLLLIWPLFIGVSYHLSTQIAERPYDQALGESLLALSRQVQRKDGRVDVNFPAPARAILRADKLDRIYYQVSDPGGELIAGDRELPRAVVLSGAFPYDVSFRDDEIGGDDVRVAYRALRADSESGEPYAVVQVAETKGKRRDMASRIVSRVVLPQIMIVPVTVFLVYLGLGRGIAPLKRLQDLIARRRPGNLAALPTAGMPKEVMPLICAFNDMMLRLEQNLAAQQRFIADAAHQMRTPLAGLKVQTELALGEDAPDELRGSLVRVNEGADRAIHLINQLLSLARADASSETTAAVERIDLQTIAAEVAREMVPLALAKSLDFGLELAAAPMLVEGNRLQLSEMLKNLIDNAIKFTPAGGRVTVRALSSHRATVEIEDDGPGIAESERELVFERFYRNPERNAAGSGLGLAIVREIVRLHRGHVEIMHAGGGRGVRVAVSFPRLRPPPAPQADSMLPAA